MTLSKTKLRRAATRGLSVGLSATTSLWLVGSSVFLAVPGAHASNDAVVSDITPSNPRIAPNGESELAVLGVNIQMDANPGGVDKRLQSAVVQLKSDDAAATDQSALANVETGRLYADSGLSGTGGQFDSNDALVNTATRTEAGGAAPLIAAVVNGAVTIADTGANLCVGVAAVAGIAVGDFVKVDSGSNDTFIGSVIDSDDNGDTAGDATCGDTAGELEVDINGLAGADALPVGSVVGDYVAAVDPVREINNPIANAVISNSVASSFSAFGAAGTGPLRTGYETAVVFGDTAADADADILTYTPPTTDTGNDAGNDLFFIFLTAGGVANQTFVASIWPDEVAAELVRIQLHDILFDNAGGGGNIAVNSNTTNNESKTVTMGADNVAPTISKAEMFDNDADGNVDRTEIVFNESMGTTVTLTSNFVTAIAAAVAGNVNAIASVPATNDDLDLNVNGTWITRTLTNDTLRIDMQGDGAHAVADNCGITGNVEPDPVATYCNATASTGDVFSVVYDQANATIAADDLVDSTGQALLDTTITSTDKARPVIMTAAQAVPGTFQVRDNNGNSMIDEIRVTGSESWGSASTVSGVLLRRTDVNPNVTYVLSGVNGFLQSAGTAADANGNALTSNANDQIRIAVTEATGADVTGVFQLSYTAASTLVDANSNEARSATGLAMVSGIVPVVSQAWIVDIDNLAAGAAIDGAADADGTIDGLVAIFNAAVEVDEDGVGILATTDMALSNGYAFNAQAPLDEDDDRLLVFPITQNAAAPNNVVDSDVTPDWTYTNDGSGDGEALCAAPSVVAGACVNANDVLVDSVISSTVVEANRMGPVMLANPNGAVLYETTSNDIMEIGESLIIVFSEALNAASFRTSYANDALFNGPSDFGWVIGGGANAMPNSVTVGVSGRVVTITATESATAALTAADTVMVGANEIYDQQGNAAPGPVTGGGVIDALLGAEQSLAAAVALTVTPAAAPPVLRINTNDENANGILDSLIVEFGGLISASTIVATDFAAARGANFTANTLGLAAQVCGGIVAGDDFACSTTAVTPDLTLTGIATMSGSNDSRIIARFTEAAEDTGAHPQLKYVRGSLADSAGNKIATFNANAADNTKMDLNITNAAGDFPSQDGVAPKVMKKLLRDRDLDGKIDQLLAILSETMLNGLAPATIVNGVLASNGFAVAGKTIAANGAIGNNNNYQDSTFAVTNAQFTVDVTEGSASDTALPAVTYASSGQHRDTGGQILGNIAAGGEMSDFGLAPPPPAAHMDGDLLKGSGPAVYIVKHVGSKLFKRHVLSSAFDTFYTHLAPFWSKVKSVDDATMNSHSLSAWIRVAGTAGVYEVNDDGSKHWITCADDSVAGQDCANEWTSSGRDADGIYTVNQAEYNSYVTGPNVVMPDVMN